MILSTAGLNRKDIKAVDSGGVVAGINMVVEGRADAATAALSMPALRKARCDRARRIARLSISAQGHRQFMEKEWPASTP